MTVEPMHSRGFTHQEFCADFVAIAKRTLSAEEYKVFSWRYLLGADLALINRKLGRDRNDRSTLHLYYSIQEKLGEAFAETEPFGLWPVDEYFTKTRTAPTAA